MNTPASIKISLLLAAALCFVAGSVRGSDPWADTVVDHSPGLDGSGDHNDPLAVLGEPTRTFFDPIYQFQYVTSPVIGPFHRAAPDGEKIIVTLNRGDFLKVRFDEPVEDDPDNPYGIDLIVFGNAFFTSDRFISPDTDMEAVRLTGSLFSEPITVSVSATGIGDPLTDPDQWYTFASGPFADGLFPTGASNWNRCRHDWGMPQNFTKPVDPAIEVADFRGLSAADALDLYGASGGGTGLDLAESGFAAIRYVYLTGAGGEVDAVVDVSPGLIVPADTDRDGDVDLVDTALLHRCFSGPGGGLPDCDCNAADLDGDDDVDLADAALQVAALTGPRNVE